MRKFNVVSHLLNVDSKLEWPIYDRKGALMLDTGTRISSQEQLDALRARGIYQLAENSPDAESSVRAVITKTNITAFDSVRSYAADLETILAAIAAGTLENANKKIGGLVKTIQNLCANNADAVLGAVHLLHDIRYTAIHPTHKAILCAVVAPTLNLVAEQRFALIAAALTDNVSIIEFQEELRHQTSPLTDKQWIAMKAHPRESVSMLEHVGVTNKLWLDIVEQHHERTDGSGYYGLGSNEICAEAKILGLTDVYSASVSPRAYRPSRLACESLKDLFLERGNLHGEELSLIFIKTLSVFPPGTFVRLNNNEVAVVIKRPSKNAMWPEVKSILRANGKPYYNPVHRDTNRDKFGIKEMCRLDQTLPCNLARLW